MSVPPEEIARIYDVPVEALYENYGMSLLAKIHVIMAIQKAREEWVKRFLEMPLR